MSESTVSSPRVESAQKGPRALRILAKSVFRELKSSGYSRSDIVAFATEILSLVSSDLREESDATDLAAE
jgi:hypothetical protein